MALPIDLTFAQYTASKPFIASSKKMQFAASTPSSSAGIKIDHSVNHFSFRSKKFTMQL
jgi:hypothetical protein